EPGAEDDDLRPRMARRPANDLFVEERGPHGDPELAVLEEAVDLLRDGLAFLTGERSGPRIGDQRFLSRARTRAIRGDEERGPTCVTFTHRARSARTILASATRLRSLPFAHTRGGCFILPSVVNLTPPARAFSRTTRMRSAS